MIPASLPLLLEHLEMALVICAGEDQHSLSP